MSGGGTHPFTVLHWGCLRIGIRFIGFMTLVWGPFGMGLIEGYNHVPYFNCPASKKCRGCDAGKFFGMTRLV
jgi:hypothetical protein